MLHLPSARSHSCSKIVKSHRSLFLLYREYECPAFIQIMLSVPLRRVILQVSVSGLIATSPLLLLISPCLSLFHNPNQFVSITANRIVESQLDCSWALNAGKSLLGHPVNPLHLVITTGLPSDCCVAIACFCSHFLCMLSAHLPGANSFISLPVSVD